MSLGTLLNNQEKDMKKIYIADIKSWPKWTGYGHYISVAQNYIEILDGKAEVIIAGCKEYQKKFSGKQFYMLPWSNKGNYKLEKIETLINAIYLFWRAKGEIIVLQQSTSLTSFVAIALFYWFSGKLFLIQYNTEAISSKYKRFIWRLAKWKINGLICPNERIAKAYGIKSCIVTDYICCNQEPSYVPYEKRKWDFGFIGTITNDKGTIQALETLAPLGHKILIAGRIGNGEQYLQNRLDSLLERFPNIEHHIGFVSDIDYKYFIQYSKYCVLNYQGTYLDRSSGVVLDIIFNGTPVIGTYCDALKMVKDNHMGVIYEELSKIDVNDLLNPTNYEKTLRSIKNYLVFQLEYRSRLIKLILNNSIE